MKINKNLLICALLALMVLLCVNAASAQDLQDTNLTANDVDDVVSVDLDNGDQVEEVAGESDVALDDSDKDIAAESDVDDALGIEADEDVLSASGNTITVDGNGGGDYKTISEAVSAASGGETIFIKNGNYAENAMQIGVYKLSNGEELAKEIPGLVSSEEPEDEGTVVTPENFFDFFDEGGFLYDGSIDKLTFKGEFRDLGTGVIYFLDPITVIGKDAVFNDVAFCVLGDEVNLINLTFNVDGIDFDEWGNEGAVIYVDEVSDVLIDGVNVNYVTPEDINSYGIYLKDVTGAQVINSNIVFDANNNGEAHTYALHIRDCEDVTVENNTIDAILPSLNVDFSYWGSIDTDLVLAVGIQAGEDIRVIKNRINSNVKAAAG